MTTVELIERLVILERLMTEEMVKGLPNDYLRGLVEGKRDTYHRVLQMLTNEIFVSIKNWARYQDVLVFRKGN